MCLNFLLMCYVECAAKSTNDSQSLDYKTLTYRHITLVHCGNCNSF